VWLYNNRDKWNCQSKI